MCVKSTFGYTPYCTGMRVQYDVVVHEVVVY